MAIVFRVVSQVFKVEEYIEIPNNGKVIIGRDEKACDFSVGDERVSSSHFELTMEDAKIYVQDLGSKNGTFINKKRVQSNRLYLGDILHAGKFFFMIIGSELTLEERKALTPTLSKKSEVTMNYEKEEFEILTLDQFEGSHYDENKLEEEFDSEGDLNVESVHTRVLKVKEIRKV
ncbi:MAG: FHA domain-containing protein [Bacteriovoracaceae bacterium]